MAASIVDGRTEGKLDNGLITGHAYTLIAVNASVVEPRFKFVQLRNPHGRGGEWNGAWCDSSDMWQKYPKVTPHPAFQTFAASSGSASPSSAPPPALSLASGALAQSAVARGSGVPAAAFS